MSQGEGQEIHKEEKSTGSEHGGEAAEEERLPLKVLDAKKKKKKEEDDFLIMFYSAGFPNSNNLRRKSNFVPG